MKLLKPAKILCFIGYHKWKPYLIENPNKDECNGYFWDFTTYECATCKKKETR